MNDLSFDIAARLDETILFVAGEIDAANAGDLLEMIITAEEAFDLDLVVDLSQVTFCDSSGLDALVAARRHIVRSGHAFKIQNPQPQVERILALTGLNGWLSDG